MNNIIQFVGYAERVAALKLRLTPKHTLTLIQVYGPTSDHNDEEIEDFYDVLNKACDEQRGTWNLVLGDFNAKIGIRQPTESFEVLGPHGLGRRNDNGA